MIGNLPKRSLGGKIRALSGCRSVYGPASMHLVPLRVRPRKRKRRASLYLVEIGLAPVSWLN
jgi:hypothetical protein